MTKTEITAVDTIIELIKGQVYTLNSVLKSGTDDATFLRLYNVLNGMMVCLKNIAPVEDRHNYAVNYLEDGVEFGFYNLDSDGCWVTICDWNII